MDPNALRQLGFFTVPNSQVQSFRDAADLLASPSSFGPATDTEQTVNPVDQPFNLSDGQSNQSSSLWDTNPVTRDQGASNPSSTAPTSLSLDFLLQPTSPVEQDRVARKQPQSARSSVSGHRQILPTRPPKKRDGHERKRSKLSTEATPFDSVDYWMQFDNEESLADIPESMTAEILQSKSKNRQPPDQRSINPSQTLNTTASSQPSMATRFDDFGDDSALDNALSDDEDYSGINLADELSKIETIPQADIPQREGLYSTPLSWEKPQPGIRMDQLIGFTPPSLNEAEQRRLIAIAMNPGPSMGGLGSNLMFGLNSGMSTPMGSGFGSATMGQFTDSAPLSRPTGQPPARPQPKRQTSTSDKGKGNAKGSDRAAHNDIERKYRTNLKDRIAELKNAVPALQTISEDAGDEDEPSQPGRAPKVSKGTVLTKATEYIQQLERRNKQIMTEHQTLSRRLQAFEQLLAAQARPAFRVPDYSRALFDPRAFC